MNSVARLLRPVVALQRGCCVVVVAVRHSGTALPNRHWNPTFKKLRREKFLKVTLPNFDKQRKQEAMTMKDLRLEMKKMGVPPHRPWRERPIHVSCTDTICDPFVPPELEGKASALSKDKPGEVFDRSKNAFQNARAQRKIKNYDLDFDPKTFVEKATELYVQAHQALQDRDEEKLHELVTEHAFPQMWDELKLKSIRWQFVETLEPSKVVQMRTMSVTHQDNIFAQVVVRMHTKQKLAVFDQFGRLLMGNENVAKNVLEFVVFEKHLSNLYGVWRLHDKIKPSWLEADVSVLRTYRLPSPVVAPKASKDVVLEEENIVATQDDETPPSASTRRL